MTHQFPVIALLAIALTLLPFPVNGREIIRNWERIQQNQHQRQGNTQENRMQGNQDGVQELHGAVNESDCYKMEQKFQRQGRRIRLVETKRSNNPGAVLRWMCVFQGEDAQTGYYDERRY